ncbi:MAG TPA: PilZ domain-containing protein [Polyangia bacterium]
MTERPRKDSRRDQRKAIDINVTVSVGGDVVRVHTRDISRSGICLVSDTAIARDTDLELRLVLSLGDQNMSEPLLVGGRSVWCTALFGRFQVGVMFADLDDEQLRFLDLFMRFIDGDVRPAGYDPGPEPSPPERPEDKDDPFRP